MLALLPFHHVPDISLLQRNLMTTVYRAPSAPESRLVNPFDSDDETAPPAFSTSKTTPPVGGHKYGNPFEDESLNPFDDEAGSPFEAKDLKSWKESKNGKADKGILAENPHSRFAAPKEQDRFSGVNPFDEDFGRNETPFKEDPDSGKIRASKTKAPPAISSFGDSAVKAARKIKETGANQAEKLKQGGAYQAQKVKETTYKAFKPRDSSNIAPKSKRPSHDDDEKRDLLLETDGDRRLQRTIRPSYADNFLEAGGLESKSVQELETYAVHKSEETTSQIYNCLKVAEGIKEDASTTLITLHQQGEQIRRTHEVTVEIDHDLSTGEKLLGSLGGMFSRTWKPKKTRHIKGPMIQDDPSIRRVQHLEQRVALGLGANNSKSRVPKDSVAWQSQSEQLTTQSKLELEKGKQDDTLSDLSNVLDQLKEMSMDMGKEISSQNEALDHLQDDVVELGERVKGANVRGRRLLGK